jgi:hypothetical protein
MAIKEKEQKRRRQRCWLKKLLQKKSNEKRPLGKNRSEKRELQSGRRQNNRREHKKQGDRRWRPKDTNGNETDEAKPRINNCKEK